MMLKHKGIAVYYSVYGHGTPLVLLHGFLENSSMWTPFISELSKKSCVICIDLFGHGKTGCIGYIHTMELMAECVACVLKKLNIDKVSIAGHSMGGYVALAYAEKNAKKLNGLCLINSTAEADSVEKIINRNRAIAAVKENHKKFINLSISNLFRPKNRTLFSNEIKLIKQEALQTPLQGIIAALEGMKIRKNNVLLLKNPPYKQLMIISKKDPVLDYKKLINQTKNTSVRVVEFPNGHMSHVENKDVLLLELMHFIDSVKT